MVLHNFNFKAIGRLLDSAEVAVEAVRLCYVIVA
jgi:hypothetical protein